MTVGILEIELHIPDAGSLKAKRKITLSLKDRIRRQFNVSLAETEGQNTWQRCGLTIAMAASSQAAVEREFTHILNLIDKVPEVVVMEQWIDFV